MAIVPENNVEAYSATGQSSHSFSYALQKASGNNRLVVVVTTWEDNTTPDVSSITFDGTAMTLVQSALAGTGYSQRTTMYYMLDTDLPASAGSYTVVVTAGAAIQQEIYVGVIEYSGIKQEAPDDSDQHVITSAGNVDNTLTVDENDSVAIGAFGCGETTFGAADNLTALQTQALTSSAGGFGHNLNADIASIAVGWDTMSVRAAFVCAVWAPAAAVGVAPTGTIYGPLIGPLGGVI